MFKLNKVSETKSHVDGKHFVALLSLIVDCRLQSFVYTSFYHVNCLLTITRLSFPTAM